MNQVNRTLYIPLYGKSYVSRRGLFLEDHKAEEIWTAEGFPLKGKSRSKWLAFYMGIRAAVFDQWVRRQLADNPEAVVIHLGCGMDSRFLRLGTCGHSWYDIDFPEVIRERKRYFSESDHYHMQGADVRDPGWPAAIPERKSAIIVMEGISMYLTTIQLQSLFHDLSSHFGSIILLTDCYTDLAAKMSRYRNPVHEVGVTQVYGLDRPEILNGTGLTFAEEHSMTPPKYIQQLEGMEKAIFQKLYAGKFSQKLYRLYEYRKV